MDNIIQKIIEIHSKLTLKVANTKVLKKIAKLHGNVINDYSKCIYCNICENKCPIGAIKVEPILLQWNIDNDKCLRCLKCIKYCPKGSISLNKNK
ncbi:NADH-quinone oxidoreductase subunit I [Paraclostridium bifermentans]|uniref:NADH-quinone oxidoreductase subunit I n=1 Tax=Paraclostridium bifermentans TaxID=1490 RepID=UPI0006B33D55|nr:4Fe-4S binding protein [Paraclostridium bifermentans]OSB08493.1 hypothetical protein B2H97_14080 [Paraclostridium bifermentans]